jgi:GDP-L-fucose synthase
MKRLLLTGGSGMVGRNIREHPSAQRYTVLAPSRAELDLNQTGDVLAFIRDARPDFVIHAAGRVGGIQANMADPVRFLSENIQIGLNVINGAHEAGVRTLLNLGSSCMYPREAPNPLVEEMILTGKLEPTNEGYAIAKIVAARLCAYISATDTAFQYKTFIPCNLYGRYDAFGVERSHLVPSIIRKVHQAVTHDERTVDVWGDGLARREFMYAGDLADCVFEAVERFDSLPDIMNVGPGVDHTVTEYYRAAAQVIGFTGGFRYDTSKPVGMARKLVSPSRAAAWGWRARTELLDGLERTYAFYREHLIREEAA